MEANEVNCKVYIEVTVSFDENGCMFPTEVIWEDGNHYTIDRVSDIRPAPAMKAGGQGDRYTVFIGGHQTYLFFERSTTIMGPVLGRWFVERRGPSR